MVRHRNPGVGDVLNDEEQSITSFSHPHNSSPPARHGAPPNVSSPEEERQYGQIHEDDDDDNDQLQEQDDPNEVAAAAAEVSVLPPGDPNSGGSGGTTSIRTGDQAVMGANDEGIPTVEDIDESGELVRTAFLQFLSEYRQEVQTEADEQSSNHEHSTSYIYPYSEQATAMANHQMQRQMNDVDTPTTQHSSNTTGSASGGLFSNTLFLNFRHVLLHDPELADAIRTQFTRFERFLRKAIQSFVLSLHPELENDSSSSSSSLSSAYFVAVYNMPNTLSIRRLRTDLVGCLSSVTGTVTRTSDVRPELLIASFTCNECGLEAGNLHQQYHYTRPAICRNPRCKNKAPNKWKLNPKRSLFVDWQKLRVQEHSNQIPPGSMPRSMDVILRNEMVERAKAGDKCVFTGSLVVIPDASALARSGDAAQASKSNNSRTNNDAAGGGGGGVRGLAALGVRELTYRTCFVATSVFPTDAIQQANQNEQIIASFLFGKFKTSASSATVHQEETADDVAMEYTSAQREELLAMKSSPKLYEQMVDSIAPTTFGHREVKKGILLMLLGGVHKTTVDGVKLRGDINVCVVGDPSTAKSQFLKYVHSFLPSRAVYTSGKASSAAGLTASVQRDQDTGEYCLEAGALMLADNGVCCIDEFDKMDATDQVAIHEAMEQQTISITKAGIQATLNARASILAAANPIYGRYDRSKTLKSNVALSAPILSRFDLFFVVLDDCNPDSDRQVARHILNVHRCVDQAVHPPFTKDQMRRYIRFARTLHPKITPESQRVMVDCYRKLRQSDTLGRSRSAYRITVRQLESMIRLSEALARLYCSDEIQPSYVREAFRLLKTSIIQVETSDVEVDDDNDDTRPDGGDAAAVADENDVETEQEESETQRMESQVNYPGEYNQGEERAQQTSEELPSDSNQASDALGQKRKRGQSESDEPPANEPTNKSKKKKKKVKISFTEYEAIASAVAGHLRALESTTVDDDGNEQSEEGKYLTWQQLLEWYLEQSEQEIGDSLERLEEMRKKVNLVIRHLLNVDRVLVAVGSPPKDKKDELKTLLAVHPNHDVSQM